MRGSSDEVGEGVDPIVIPGLPGGGPRRGVLEPTVLNFFFSF